VIEKVERLPHHEGEQMLSGEVTAPANARRPLLVGMTPGPDVESAFSAWYDVEHPAAAANVPAVLCARRFHTSGGPKYIALCHLAPQGSYRIRRRGRHADAPARARPGQQPDVPLVAKLRGRED
jgi:hypothetical protein